MRTFVAVAVVFAFAGCAGARHAAAASNDAAAPSPLRSCETRELAVDGTDVVVASNADATLASVHVVTASSPAARGKALRDLYRAFGPLRRDPSVVAHESKWGLTTLTDRCGRQVK